MLLASKKVDMDSKNNSVSSIASKCHSLNSILQNNSTLHNNSTLSPEPLRQNRGRYILRRIFRRPPSLTVDENGGRFLLPFIESAVQVRSII